MDNRLSIQGKLEQLVGYNVYFQPPASVHLVYPCAIYNLVGGDIKRADNMAYHYTNRYEILIIYKQSNTEIIEKVLQTFPMCSLSRVYIADNLYHYSFNLYY